MDSPIKTIYVAAYEALHVVHQNLTKAERLATELARSPSPEARSVALWTLGKIHYEQGRLPDAQRTMRQAAQISRRAGLAPLEGAVWLSLAAVLVEAGHTTRALHALDRAEPLVEGVEVGRLVQQRAFVLFHLGEWRDAIESANRALTLMRSRDDLVGEARLLLLRGVCHLGAGSQRAATTDLVAAKSLADQIGERLISALAEQDLGCAYGRLGDIPTALQCFERARDAYERDGGAERLQTILDADLAETLLLGGLSAEAVEAAARSAAAAVRACNVVNEAEARLVLARALLVDQRYAEARTSAQLRGPPVPAISPVRLGAVRRGTSRHRRPSRRLRTMPALPVRSLAAPSSSPTTSNGAAGMPSRSTSAPSSGGSPSRVATRPWPSPSRASVQAARKGHVAERAGAHHAVALMRLAENDPVGARRSLRAGLALIEHHRSAMGAGRLGPAWASTASSSPGWASSCRWLKDANRPCCTGASDGGRLLCGSLPSFRPKISPSPTPSPACASCTSYGSRP